MGINGWERKGLFDLLHSETFRQSTFSIAKIVSKSMLTLRTIEGIGYHLLPIAVHYNILTTLPNFHIFQKQ